MNRHRPPSGRRRFLRGMLGLGLAVVGLRAGTRCRKAPTNLPPIERKDTMETRTVKRTSRSQPTMEGAGVHLRRAFGFEGTNEFDPFLLLDDFRSDEPEHYRAGFPWHPHRGIETITYVLAGDVEHGDSLGNRGVIGSGDVQWMTAGSGIIHQEMPKGDAQGRMYGFQLWANLPARNKMMDPRYRDVRADGITEVALADGVRVKVIAGRLGEAEGPVQDVIIEPEYLDVSVPAGVTFRHPSEQGRTVFAYVFEGRGSFGPDQGVEGVGSHDEGTLVLFGDGDQVEIRTAGEPVRFLLVSGKPLGEPVAWRGPIVMNTEEELQTAFDEYRDGTFLRHQLR